MPRALAAAILALVVLTALPAAAARAEDWVAVSVRGTVVQLVGTAWQEFGRGASVVDGQALRTLQSGRVVLSRGEDTLTIGAGTAIEWVADDGAAKIRQYSGSLTLSAGSGRVVIETPVFDVAAAGGGIVSVAFDGSETHVVVHSGDASVTDRVRGRRTALSAGQAMAGSTAPGPGGAPEGPGASGGGGASGKDTAPGQSGSAPGRSGAAPGQSGSAPGQGQSQGGNAGASGQEQGNGGGNGGNGKGRN